MTAATGPKTPLMVASVGTYSGPLGMFMLTHLSGAQVWVKRTNRAGGLRRRPWASTTQHKRPDLPILLEMNPAIR